MHITCLHSPAMHIYKLVLLFALEWDFAIKFDTAIPFFLVLYSFHIFSNQFYASAHTISVGISVFIRERCDHCAKKNLLLLEKKLSSLTQENMNKLIIKVLDCFRHGHDFMTGLCQPTQLGLTFTAQQSHELWTRNRQSY